MATRIITDSTSYIPPALLEELEITVVSLSVVFPDGTAVRETEVEDVWFYDRLRASNTLPTSSQPTPAEMEEAFETAVTEGHAAVGVFISSDMSGTMASAQLAVRAVLERHPGAEIEIVDSRSNSMQLGLSALAAARAAAGGASAADAAAAARDCVARTRYLFTPHTLENMRRGGRIGGASALLGTLLQIRPVLTVENGVTDVFDKVRTKRKAMERIAAAFREDVNAHGLREAYVHHIADEAEGRALASIVAAAVDVEPVLVPIGPVVGLHVGIGSVGLVYETERPLR